MTEESIIIPVHHFNRDPSKLHGTPFFFILRKVQLRPPLTPGGPAIPGELVAKIKMQKNWKVEIVNIFKKNTKR